MTKVNTAQLRKVRSLGSVSVVLRSSVTPRSHQPFNLGKSACSASNFTLASSNGHSFPCLLSLSEYSCEHSSFDEHVPTSFTLSKLNLLQGSIVMLAIMALINVIIGSCIVAFISSTSSSDGDVLASEFDVYGLLSTEVILPLSLLMQGPTRRMRKAPQRRLKRSHGSSRNVLGSASSFVIDLVGPILPFVGGVDLRRLHPFEVYEWIRSCVFRKEHASNFLAGSIPRGGSIETMMSNSSKKELHPSPNDASTDSSEGTTYNPVFEKNRPLILGGPEPFISIEDIAELNLEEIALAFQLSRNHDLENVVNATDIGRPREQMRQLVAAMQEAAALSRGIGVHPAEIASPPLQSLTSDSIDFELPLNGNIDASLFCAALRVFAEWRMLRTVPDGYKSYAVGMALGLKDVVQNIAKVENVMRQWIERKSLDLASQDSANEMILRGPTVRDLLEYERDIINAHPNLPRLNGGAAIGLLWTLRQLLYQSAVFQNILDTPNKYPNSKTAVGAAYSEVYDRYHGWAVSKIFNYSFKSAPEPSLIFNSMDINKLREITEEAKYANTRNDCAADVVVDVQNTDMQTNEIPDRDATFNRSFLAELSFWDVNINANRSATNQAKVSYSSDSLVGKDDDWIGKLVHRAAKLAERLDEEFCKIGSKLLSTQRLLAHWGEIHMEASDTQEEKDEPSHKVDPSQVESLPPAACNSIKHIGLEGPELDVYVATRMEAHIRQQISHYLRLLKPVTFELVTLFEELNMNDPSKV